MASLNLICTVCKESYKNSDAIMSTNCGHVFHSTCMSEVRKQSMYCPSCRMHILTTYRLYLTFEEDKQVVDLKSKIKEHAEQKSLMQQRLDRSEQDQLKLIDQLTKKDSEKQGLHKNFDSLKEQNESLSKQIESKKIELQKMQEALNSDNHQSTTTMLQEEIKILKEKNNFISKELNKEVHAGMQLSVEKMKLENMLHQFKSMQPVSVTPPSLPATPPTTQPTLPTSSPTPPKSEKPTASNKVKKAVPAKAYKTGSYQFHGPQMSGPPTNRDSVPWVVIKNVKGTFPDQTALKRFVINLTDVMKIFYSDDDVEQVTVMKRKPHQDDTKTFVVKFKYLALKIRFLSHKDSLKENEHSKDLIIHEYVTNYTNLLCHYAKTLLSLGYKRVYTVNNVVFVKKEDGSIPIRINGFKDVDKLKNETLN